MDIQDPSDSQVNRRRPDQYIGLERINRTAVNAARPPAIYNFSLVLSHISMTAQDIVFTPDLFSPSRLRRVIGMFHCYYHRFLVDNEVSAIVAWGVYSYSQRVLGVPADSIC